MNCPTKIKCLMLTLILGSLFYSYWNAHTPAPKVQRIYHCLTCDEIIYADDPEACKECAEMKSTQEVK